MFKNGEIRPSVRQQNAALVQTVSLGGVGGNCRGGLNVAQMTAAHQTVPTAFEHGGRTGKRAVLALGMTDIGNPENYGKQIESDQIILLENGKLKAQVPVEISV